VDQARFVTAAKGRELLHPDQKVFVERLEALLNNPEGNRHEEQLRKPM
jgi:hypothetical protein